MMDEEEFTLPPLLVTDDVIKGLKSGAVRLHSQLSMAACSLLAGPKHTISNAIVASRR